MLHNIHENIVIWPAWLKMLLLVAFTGMMMALSITIIVYAMEYIVVLWAILGLTIMMGIGLIVYTIYDSSQPEQEFDTPTDDFPSTNEEEDAIYDDWVDGHIIPWARLLGW